MAGTPEGMGSWFGWAEGKSKERDFPPTNTPLHQKTLPRCFSQSWGKLGGCGNPGSGWQSVSQASLCRGLWLSGSFIFPPPQPQPLLPSGQVHLEHLSCSIPSTRIEVSDMSPEVIPGGDETGKGRKMVCVHKRAGYPCRHRLIQLRACRK